jgi:hypothetical protein
MIHPSVVPIDQIAYQFTHAPVVMGFLAQLLAIAPLVAKLFGGASKARAEGRVAEAGLNAEQDAANINRAVVDRNLTTANQDSAYKNAIREGVNDFSVTRPDGVPNGRATGGLRPSAIVGGNALGKQFKEQDLASIMAGTPKLTPPPQAGKFDKFLNIAGGIAGLAGLAGQAKNAFSGGSSVPQINTSASIADDPTAFLKNMPTVDPANFTPPPTSTYRRPTFTSRF